MTRTIDLNVNNKEYIVDVVDELAQPAGDERQFIVEASSDPKEFIVGDRYSNDAVQYDGLVTDRDQFDLARMIIIFSGVVFILLMGVWFWHEWPNVSPDVFVKGLAFIENKIYPIVLIIIGYYFGKNGPSKAKSS